MITAVDTSCLINVMKEDEQAIASLANASRDGRLVVCEVVYSELCGGMSQRSVDAFCEDFKLELVSSNRSALALAGQFWRTYIKNKGRNKRVLADFFVGAHALTHADRLLANDRGFYRSYFKKLPIIS